MSFFANTKNNDEVSKEEAKLREQKTRMKLVNLEKKLLVLESRVGDIEEFLSDNDEQNEQNEQNEAV